MEILHLEKDFAEQLPFVLKTLEKGGLVVAPSDTVYGLLVDARNEAAVQKLIAFKNRPAGKPISVFVNGLDMAHGFVEIVPQQENVLREILPGPFTVIFPSKHKTSKLLESERGTLGVRFIKNDFVNALVGKLGRPVTATSANQSAYPPNYSVESLMNQVSKKSAGLIDLVVDAGKLPYNKPSTVIDFSSSDIKTLREGDLSFTDKNTVRSASVGDTRKMAQDLVKKYLHDKPAKPLLFLLQGELGAGKTVFVKGAAELFGIGNIISPTFTIYYEYPVKNYPFLKNLYHFDLYNIEEKDEFNQLGIEKLLSPENIFFVEWGEKIGDLKDLIKDKAKIIGVKLKYLNENEREIEISG